MAGCGVDNVSRLAGVGAMGGTALGRSGKERLARSEEELSSVDGSAGIARVGRPASRESAGIARRGGLELADAPSREEMFNAGPGARGGFRNVRAAHVDASPNF